jgi:AMMECR1 domain-containing protein
MNDQIDELLNSLEKMIDAQDDMWEEEKYSNYRYREKIYREQYLPARADVKEALRLVIVEVVREQLQK